jgi:GAF domain-containing protein
MDGVAAQEPDPEDLGTLAPGQTEAFARRADEVLRHAADLARDLVGAHQAAASLIVAGDWSTARKAFSLSDKYRAWFDYKTPPRGLGLHALVVAGGGAMRLSQAELEAHPGWIAFGAERGRHPPMRGWLAAPLLGEDGHVYGLLQLSDKVDGSDFTVEDQAQLVRLSCLATLALDALCSAYNIDACDRRLSDA